MPETDFMKRDRQTAEIISLTGIEDDRQLVTQLKSLTCLGIEVVHTLVVRQEQRMFELVHSMEGCDDSRARVRSV